jgi:hypothetical protein
MFLSVHISAVNITAFLPKVGSTEEMKRCKGSVVVPQSLRNTTKYWNIFGKFFKFQGIEYAEERQKSVIQILLSEI